MKYNDANQDVMPLDYGNMPSNISDNKTMYMPAKMPELAGNAAAQYPELYYKLQPHIMMICDQMDAHNIAMTKDIMENTGKKLHEDVVKMHPEIANLDNANHRTDTMPEAQETISYGLGYGYGSGYGSPYGGYQHRGVLRDVIDILLLSEFYRRRRYPYY